MTITQWHVPIDDHNCFWYAMFTSFTEPIDKAKMREQRLAEHTLPSYAPLKNKTNQYGYNSEEQKNLTYTGMGMDINVHDQWACESMGTIQNRAKEHLGTTDKAISAYRRLLFQTIAKVEKGDLNIIGSAMKESGDKPKKAQTEPKPKPFKTQHKPITDENWTPPKDGVYDLNPTQLLAYKGHNYPQKPILIAVGGKIFDVSDGAKFYGPGAPYNVFAGRVCTKALSLGSLDPKDINDDIDFGSDEVMGQVKFYSEKYKEVGVLL